MKTGGRKEISCTGLAYTLVEVMVAIMVLAIMIVCLYAGFASGLAVTQLSRENLRATQILVKRMEDVRLYKWSQITNTLFFKTNFTSYYYPPGTNNNTQGTTYGGVISWSDPLPAGVPGDYQASLRVITMTLYWTNQPTGAGSRSNIIVRSRQMQTYVARYGMQNYVYQ